MSCIVSEVDGEFGIVELVKEFIEKLCYSQSSLVIVVCMLFLSIIISMSH